MASELGARPSTLTEKSLANLRREFLVEGRSGVCITLLPCCFTSRKLNRCVGRRDEHLQTKRRRDRSVDVNR